MSYFRNHNNYFHGIMFHHFHDKTIHKTSQGSISKDDFYKIIKYIGRENIINSDEFIYRINENSLKDNHLCLTFDDSLRCQYDVALPVLEELKIKSFFFIYSSIFEKQPDLLEVYRYFRINYFGDINEFYFSFFKKVPYNLKEFFLKNKDKINMYEKKFPYYSINDIKFRLIRDYLISQYEYKTIMREMFDEKNCKQNSFDQILFLNSKHVNTLSKLGHQIGLHSHSHPTRLEKLSYEDQYRDYKKNLDTLQAIMPKDKSINSMSHPCGSYNNDTLNILKKLNIELGFKQTLEIEPERGMKKINNSSLEIARQDHSIILKELTK